MTHLKGIFCKNLFVMYFGIVIASLEINTFQERVFEQL